MTTTSRRTRWVAATAGLLLTAGLATATAAPADARPHQGTYPSTIALPNGFQPEGIAIGRYPYVFSGSRITGDIYAADLRTGKGEVIVKGPGTASLGVKLDRTKLFVAGGGAGNGRVVDVLLRTTERSFTFTANKSFVNDVVLSKRYAWFTDSLQAQLYRVDRKGSSTAVTKLALKGDWVQAAGVNNANGIQLTPDRKALLVVQSNTGFLFRVDPKTGVAKRVDLGGTLLTNGDGLLRKGRTLYAVQNQLNKIAVLHLNKTGTKGTLTKTITSPRFDVPSTVAAYKGNLYLPNARFGAADAGTTTYAITKVAR